MLRIRNWAANFETHESRKLKRLDWVSVPNYLIDLRYRILIDHPDGAAHFGAWIAVVEIGSTCKVRGTLAEGGASLTPRHLALKSGLPCALFESVIPRLLEIEWLEEIPDGTVGSTVTPGNSSGSLPDSSGSVTGLRDVAGETSAYIDTDSYIDSNSETLCASDDARGAGALELIPPKAKAPDAIKVWFDSEFWPTYPRKRAKPQALKAARRHGKTATVREAIMQCLRQRLPALQEQFRPEGDFRPYPERWLNMTPWLEPEEAGAPKPETTEQRVQRLIYGDNVK
ncbi:MAG: hypothetical protein WBL61_23690 [Bryobacteraceae bacterium]